MVTDPDEFKALCLLALINKTVTILQKWLAEVK
jgi:hypothetical protein